MTLNQVINSLKNYFESHPLVNTTNVTLDDADFNAINNLVYPVANIQYIDTDVNDKRFQHNFKIIVADLTNPNIEGIDFEIFSDTLQIVGDFTSSLENNYDYDWIKTTNIQPFQDSNVDRISGVVFTIGIITFIEKNIDC